MRNQDKIFRNGGWLVSGLDGLEDLIVKFDQAVTGADGQTQFRHAFVSSDVRNPAGFVGEYGVCNWRHDAESGHPVAIAFETLG